MKKTQQYWLMKSEPDELSIQDLELRKVWYWDGVRNYEARNFMRDQMQIGDLVIFYHSNAKPSGPAGIAKVTSLPYPDHTQFDKRSKYYDSKASKDKPRWFMVDVAFVSKFPRTISREELLTVPELRNMKLWSRSRLSITPLTESEFALIKKLGK